MTLYLTKHPAIALAFIRTAQETSSIVSNKRRARCSCHCCFRITRIAGPRRCTGAAVGPWSPTRSRNCRSQPSRFCIRKSTSPTNSGEAHVAEFPPDAWTRMETHRHGRQRRVGLLSRARRISRTRVERERRRRVGAAIGSRSMKDRAGDVFLAQISAWDTPPTRRSFSTLTWNERISVFEITKVDGTLSSEGDQRATGKLTGPRRDRDARLASRYPRGRSRESQRQQTGDDLATRESLARKS